MTDPARHSERLMLDTSRLPDAALRRLRLFADELAHDPTPEARRFGRELYDALADLLSSRVLAWVDYCESTGFPGWDHCVAALSPEGGCDVDGEA